ncbi:hypothetical protein D3C76_1468750 [compost metagenome]
MNQKLSKMAQLDDCQRRPLTQVGLQRGEQCMTMINHNRLPLGIQLCTNNRNGFQNNQIRQCLAFE